MGGFTAVSASSKLSNHPLFPAKLLFAAADPLLLRKDWKLVCMHVPVVHANSSLGERIMKKFSRYSLFLALFLVLLTTACGAEQGASPTPIGTLLPTNSELTNTPYGPTVTIGTTPTATGSGLSLPDDTSTPGLETATVSAGGVAGTQTAATQAPALGSTRRPSIPVTGQDIILVECQFCVDTRAHALLVLPDTATFQITSPAPTSTTTTDMQPTCTTVEVDNGRQVVLCSGPEMTPLVVNICTDASHCTDFPVDLLACPLTPGGSVGPAATQTPGTAGTGGAATTSTTSPGGTAVNTATPLSGTATTTATP
jgi:hypothetical protein